MSIGTCFSMSSVEDKRPPCQLSSKRLEDNWHSGLLSSTSITCSSDPMTDGSTAACCIPNSPKLFLFLVVMYNDVYCSISMSIDKSNSTSMTITCSSAPIIEGSTAVCCTSGSGVRTPSNGSTVITVSSYTYEYR